jgi:hypothetical protein
VFSSPVYGGAGGAAGAAIVGSANLAPGSSTGDARGGIV